MNILLLVLFSLAIFSTYAAEQPTQKMVPSLQKLTFDFVFCKLLKNNSDNEHALCIKNLLENTNDATYKILMPHFYFLAKELDISYQNKIHMQQYNQLTFNLHMNAIEKNNPTMLYYLTSNSPLPNQLFPYTYIKPCKQSTQPVDTYEEFITMKAFAHPLLVISSQNWLKELFSQQAYSKEDQCALLQVFLKNEQTNLALTSKTDKTILSYAIQDNNVLLLENLLSSKTFLRDYPTMSNREFSSIVNIATLNESLMLLELLIQHYIIDRNVTEHIEKLNNICSALDTLAQRNNPENLPQVLPLIKTILEHCCKEILNSSEFLEPDIINLIGLYCNAFDQPLECFWDIPEIGLTNDDDKTSMSHYIFKILTHLFNLCDSRSNNNQKILLLLVKKYITQLENLRFLENSSTEKAFQILLKLYQQLLTFKVIPCTDALGRPSACFQNDVDEVFARDFGKNTYQELLQELLKSIKLFLSIPSTNKKVLLNNLTDLLSFLNNTSEYHNPPTTIINAKNYANENIFNDFLNELFDIIKQHYNEQEISDNFIEKFYITSMHYFESYRADSLSSTIINFWLQHCQHIRTISLKSHICKKLRRLLRYEQERNCAADWNSMYKLISIRLASFIAELNYLNPLFTTADNYKNCLQLLTTPCKYTDSYSEPYYKEKIEPFKKLIESYFIQQQSIDPEKTIVPLFIKPMQTMPKNLFDNWKPHDHTKRADLLNALTASLTDKTTSDTPIDKQEEQMYLMYAQTLCAIFEDILLKESDEEPTQIIIKSRALSTSITKNQQQALKTIAQKLSKERIENLHTMYNWNIHSKKKELKIILLENKEQKLLRSIKKLLYDVFALNRRGMGKKMELTAKKIEKIRFIGTPLRISYFLIILASILMVPIEIMCLLLCLL